MSQFFQGVTAGALPPSVPIEFTTDANSPAIPAANILVVSGSSTSVDTDDGIRTYGSAGGDTLEIQLTNTLFGTGSTSGAVTDIPVTFALSATPAAYALEFKVVAFEGTTPAGASFSLFIGARTDGAAATLIGSTDKIKNNDGALAACDADVIVSGNSVQVEVTGVAGLDLYWKVDGEYISVGGP